MAVSLFKIDKCVSSAFFSWLRRSYRPKLGLSNPVTNKLSKQQPTTSPSRHSGTKRFLYKEISSLIYLERKLFLFTFLFYSHALPNVPFEVVCLSQLDPACSCLLLLRLLQLSFQRKDEKDQMLERHIHYHKKLMTTPIGSTSRSIVICVPRAAGRWRFRSPVRRRCWR
jgi:hypothetical protein